MTNPSLPQQIDERLEELYRLHLPLEPESVANYYDSARGYYGPEEAGDERNKFGICIVTVEGHVFEAGDSDLPFALQSISKVFAYALALADRGRARCSSTSGSSRAATPSTRSCSTSATTARTTRWSTRARS